uniref:Nuclear protein MDM1 n=1 Tax=Sphenodon punctatus TaxID=8508 RepID=A0A8D0G3U4_SPHPU
MPVRFKGLSEYKRNFKWRKSNMSGFCSPSQEQKFGWAGLRSDQLGISREPKFISKRRVPYHKPQVSTSFEWKGGCDLESGLDDTTEFEVLGPPELHTDHHQDDTDQEKIETPDAPRLPKKIRSHSADSRVESAVAIAENDQKKSPPPTPAHEDKIVVSPKEHLEKMDNGFHRALQRKAGMNHSPSSNFPRNSEYQRQFVWKTPQKSSPVLAAEQVILKDRKETVLKPEDPLKQEKSETEQNRKHMQRVSEKLHCLHTGLGKVNTEYKSKFLSPAQYLYRNGNNNHYFTPTLCFQKAETYRQHVRGTHFSRDHLNQILSDNNRLWDVSSNSSSEETISNNIRALDLAGVPEKRRLAWGEPDRTEQEENQLPALEEEEEDKENKLDPAEIQQLEESDHDAIADNKKGENVTPLNSPAARSDSSPASSGKGGRLPTPKLKALGGAQRTHHDLTTPAVGGAVLVSPSKMKASCPEQIKKGSLEKRLSPCKPVSREASKRKSNRVRQKATPLLGSPAAGLKTLDPFPLRKDSWPSIYASGERTSPDLTRPECSATAPVLKSASPSYWSPSCRIQGTLRNPEFQHNGNIASPKMSHFQLPLQERNYNDEDDLLSQISARSAASGSLASQILERAQKRKEDFWGKM